MEPPLKKLRLAHDDLPLHSDNSDLPASREDIRKKLKSRFESIFEKYGRDFTGTGDEIDLETGEIYVDNGHLRSLANGDRPGPAQLDYQSDRRHDQPGQDASPPIVSSRIGCEETSSVEPAWQYPGLPQDEKAAVSPPKINLVPDPEDVACERSVSPELDVWALNQPEISVSPLEKKVRWKETEDALLLSLKQGGSVKGSNLEGRFPGRTARAVQDRWEYLQRLGIETSAQIALAHAKKLRKPRKRTLKGMDYGLDDTEEDELSWTPTAREVRRQKQKSFTTSMSDQKDVETSMASLGAPENKQVIAKGPPLSSGAGPTAPEQRPLVPRRERENESGGPLTPVSLPLVEVQVERFSLTSLTKEGKDLFEKSYGEGSDTSNPHHSEHALAKTDGPKSSPVPTGRLGVASGKKNPQVSQRLAKAVPEEGGQHSEELPREENQEAASPGSSQAKRSDPELVNESPQLEPASLSLHAEATLIAEDAGSKRSGHSPIHVGSYSSGDSGQASQPRTPTKLLSQAPIEVIEISSSPKLASASSPEAESQQRSPITPEQRGMDRAKADHILIDIHDEGRPGKTAQESEVSSSPQATRPPPRQPCLSGASRSRRQCKPSPANRSLVVSTPETDSESTPRRMRPLPDSTASCNSKSKRKTSRFSLTSLIAMNEGSDDELSLAFTPSRQQPVHAAALALSDKKRASCGAGERRCGRAFCIRCAGGEDEI